MSDAYRVLQPAAVSSEGRLMERIAALEEQARLIQRQQGKLIFVATNNGKTSAYSSTFTGTASVAVSDGVSALTIAYTPPVDVVAECHTHIGIVQKHDAAYHYVYGGYLVTPADVDGITVRRQILTQNQAGPAQFGGRSTTGQHNLAAGTSYVFSARIGDGNGGTWSYHQLDPYLWMSLKAWVA